MLMAEKDVLLTYDCKVEGENVVKFKQKKV